MRLEKFIADKSDWEYPLLYIGEESCERKEMTRVIVIWAARREITDQEYTVPHRSSKQ